MESPCIFTTATAMPSVRPAPTLLEISVALIAILELVLTVQVLPQPVQLVKPISIYLLQPLDHAKLLVLVHILYKIKSI